MKTFTRFGSSARGTLASSFGVLVALLALGCDGSGGAEGSTGAMGAMGSPGTTGHEGPAGAEGPQGPAGATGPQGPAGPAGATGADGTTGPAGTPGAQGPTGASVQGPAGPAGPQGPAGPAGMGVQGPAGPAGPAGTPGVLTSRSQVYSVADQSSVLPYNNATSVEGTGTAVATCTGAKDILISGGCTVNPTEFHLSSGGSVNSYPATLTDIIGWECDGTSWGSGYPLTAYAVCITVP